MKIEYKGAKSMNDKPLKHKVSISLDENIIDTIKEMAEYDDRSFSSYINLILRKWIQEHQNRKLYFF